MSGQDTPMWETRIADFTAGEAAYAAVFNYLVTHPDIIHAVTHACDLVDEAFPAGAGVERRLELRDETHDADLHYLVLAVRETPPREDIEEVVESINQAIYPDIAGSPATFDVVNESYREGSTTGDGDGEQEMEEIGVDDDDDSSFSFPPTDECDAVLIVYGSPVHLRMLARLAVIRHQEWINWSQDLATREKLSDDTRATWAAMWRPWEDLPDEIREVDIRWAHHVFGFLISPPTDPAGSQGGAGHPGETDPSPASPSPPPPPPQE